MPNIQKPTRQIKFRAWDRFEKKMYDSNCPDLFIGFNGRLELQMDIKENSGFAIGGHPDLILMQFTGLQDKNGKDIYEGDIIEYRNIEWMKNQIHMNRLEVVFEDGAYAILSTMPRSEFEIIGNIHENPELL